jgi:aspartyl/asparaginyl beta-hydroxylase (cupin superfamily)
MQQGTEALRQGDAQLARSLYEKITETGGESALAWLGVALACRDLGDDEAKLAALEKTLGIEPRNSRALILQADHYEAVGDARAASSYYLRAVNVAPPPDRMPADLAREIERAKSMARTYAQQYEAYLRDALAKVGPEKELKSGRFARSLDITLGKRQIFYQQPVTYYFPELPQIQFYERDEFPSLDAIEAATDDIRAELIELMKTDEDFSAYVTGEANRPQEDRHGMRDNREWSAFYLWREGEIVPDNAARCPKTMEALKDFPLAHIPNRSPNVLFSMLRPGARIPPHNGLLNTRLICHLPLIVPKGCGFRVGNDTRIVEEGKAWVFDDTIEHEAWNNSDEKRIILLFETWRPELTQNERDLVAAMFEAIDSHGEESTSN